jgi:predicted dienelactone hydrolase
MNPIPWVQGIGALVVMAVVAGTLGIAARVAFGLPPPSGPYPVGTTTLALDRAAEHDAPGGTYTVTLWYPSEPSKANAPYGPSGPGLKNSIYHHLVRTYASGDAPFTRRPGRFPVLLYVAGWGAYGSANTVLATDLASYGYVVAALSDTDFDRPPLARLGGAADFSSTRAVATTWRLARAKLEYESHRAMLVLDRLAALDASDPGGRFTNRLALDRVGTFGFSFGGAVAVDVCNLETRCAGALDLDGYLWNVRKTRTFPYFLISDLERSPRVKPDASDTLASNVARMDAADGIVQQSDLSTGGYLLQITDATHYNFTDLALFAPLQRLQSKVSPRDTAQTIDRDALAFFDMYLKGRSGLSLSPLSTPDFKLSAWSVTRIAKHEL